MSSIITVQSSRFLTFYSVPHQRLWELLFTSRETTGRPSGRAYYDTPLVNSVSGVIRCLQCMTYSARSHSLVARSHMRNRVKLDAGSCGHAVVMSQCNDGSVPLSHAVQYVLYTECGMHCNVCCMLFRCTRTSSNTAAPSRPRSTISRATLLVRQILQATRRDTAPDSTMGMKTRAGHFYNQPVSWYTVQFLWSGAPTIERTFPQKPQRKAQEILLCTLSRI